MRPGPTFQVLSGGKRIRAALCAGVCEVFAGSYRPALGYAAALEHLQNFTLVHDDIADGDEERREQSQHRAFLPSVHQYLRVCRIRAQEAFPPAPASIGVSPSRREAERTNVRSSSASTTRVPMPINEVDENRRWRWTRHSKSKSS